VVHSLFPRIADELPLSHEAESPLGNARATQDWSQDTMPAAAARAPGRHPALALDQSAFVDSTLAQWMAEDTRVARHTAQRQSAGPSAGVRGASGAPPPGARALAGTWDKLLRGGGRRSALDEKLRGTESQEVELGDDSAHGVAELLAEMQVIEAEYCEWLGQYPVAFMDPGYERAQVEAHAARVREHLSIESIFATAACAR
jgi:hypothetical protein